MEEGQAEAEGLDRLRRAYEAHREPLFRLALVLTGDPQGAEDIVQEAFVRGATKLKTLDEGEAGAYLTATVINTRRSIFRHAKVRDRSHVLVPRSQSPDREERYDLWLAVRALPRKQRAVIVLRYYEDLSERDTASILGCSVGTVKSQASRAIEHLRRRYGDEDRG